MFSRKHEFALMVCENTSWFIWDKYKLDLSALLYYFSSLIFVLYLF